MAGKFSIYKYVKLQGKGWRYARAAFHSNGKIKPNIVIVNGANGKATEEKHPEGAYFLNFNNTWIPVGADALKAQHQRKVKLNQVELVRLSGKTSAPGPNLVQLGRKVIKDEVDAYLANLELAKRPYKTVGEKRRFLTSFLRIVPKKFADEFSRNDVLTFRNELMVDYDPEYVGKQMMAVVTFFNQWLRLKLNIQKCDWPEHEQNPPEPYIDAEIVVLKTHTKGKANLLVRLFRSTGCRDMEVAHLTDTDTPHEGHPHSAEAVLSLQRVHQSREHLEAQDPGKHAQHPSERRTLGGTAGIAQGAAVPERGRQPGRSFPR